MAIFDALTQQTPCIHRGFVFGGMIRAYVTGAKEDVFGV
ncbi:MAG: hypothetical protein RL141_967 [Candidatus Parcubacteria bacterium]|jgi:hypothetical protein